MTRLPVPGSDQGNWGSVLNDFLQVSHNANGTLKNNWFNVKDFGAKGDGSIDDGPAIQAAITASGWPNNSAAIFIPPGMYTVNTTIVLDGQGATSTPGLTIVGYGAILHTIIPNTTLVQTTNSIISLTRVSFLGLTFFTNADQARGVVLNNSELCEFIGCKFIGSYSLGVEITGLSTYNRFVSCEFGNLSRGILVSGQADYLQINSCSFNEQLIGDGLNWLEFSGNTTSVQISNCNFYGSGANLPVIRLITAHQISIMGCTFSECEDTAIQLGGSGSADDNVISGCQFFNLSKHGIHIYGGARNTISNNKFRKVSLSAPKSYDAIQIEQRYSNGGGSANIITGNTGSDSSTTRYLVNEVNGANNNIIMGNIAKSGAGFNIIGTNSINDKNLIV